MRGVLGYRGLKKKIQTRSQLKRSSKKKKKKHFLNLSLLLSSKLRRRQEFYIISGQLNMFKSF